MKKSEFHEELAARLAKLPEDEREKSISYYEEIIDDRMEEENMSEEDAVAALGNIDEIVRTVVSGMPLRYIIKSRLTASRNKASDKNVWTTLLIASSIIWIPVAIAFAAAAIAIFAAVWCVIIALFASVAAFLLSGVAGAAISLVAIAKLSPGAVLVLGGSSLVLLSLGLFLIKPIITASKEIIKFTCSCAKSIKKLFVGKRDSYEVE